MAEIKFNYRNALPSNPNPKELYFIKNNNKGLLYRGSELIAETSAEEIESLANNVATALQSIQTLYETKADAANKLKEAKDYTDDKISDFENEFSESATIIAAYGAYLAAYCMQNENDFPANVDDFPNISDFIANADEYLTQLIEQPKIRDIAQEEVEDHAGNTTLHFTADEKTKLSGIEAGAQKNSITGIKGDSESSYRTGNVNITKANIGLNNVDNTSDANKPVSTAQQSAINVAKEDIQTQINQLNIGNIKSTNAPWQIISGTTAEGLFLDIDEKIDDIHSDISDLTTKKADKSTMDSHINNGTIHITAAERTKWNSAEPNQNAFGAILTSAGVSHAAESPNGSFAVIGADGITVSIGPGKNADQDITIYNDGVLEVTTGTANGTISVDGSDVAVKGLGSAAYKGLDSSLSTSSTNPVQNKVITEWLEDNVKNYQILVDESGNAYLHYSNVSAAATTSPADVMINSIEGIPIEVPWSNILDVPNANINNYGTTKLSNSVSSESQILAATPYAVKQAYDKATSAATAASNAATAANDSLISAKNYTNEQVALLLNNSSEAVDSIFELAQAMQENDDVVQALSNAVGLKADKTELTNYYTKNEIENDAVLITVADIDAICGQTIVMASEVTF